jgi:hypothetical protein
MNKELKERIILGIIALICISGGIWFVLDYFTMQSTQIQDKTDFIPTTIINQTLPAHNISVKFQNGDWADYFVINAKVPETPRFILLYKGTLSDDDLARHFKYRAPNRYAVKNSTPSKAEAPALAEKALEAYGGLPEDAVLSLVYISESVTQNRTGAIVNRSPIMTQVFYNRVVNGMSVVGERDEISLDLGENGELLVLMKRWRTLESTGKSVPVITPEAAVEKLKRGETYTKLQTPSNVFINDVRLGYYEKPGKIKEIILEPVWIFKSQNIPGFEFPVYARQFAGFSQTPAVTTKTVSGKSVQEKDPFTATFTDTSDASPTKWLWDFGDGTTSTEKNPTHKYKSTGTYNVTLTVWNDLGSDTTSQQYVIDVAPVKIAGVNSTLKATSTPGNDNETIAIITPSPIVTSITGNETIVPTTTTPSVTAPVTINETVTAFSTASVNNS